MTETTATGTRIDEGPQARSGQDGLKLLEGVRVVAFTTFLVGPAAVQYLADMGADVVKVEECTHGPHERRWSGAQTFLNEESLLFLMAHRNVRSVGLNLKEPSGREVAQGLCREADVVVSNFRPGVMERLGLGYETLRRDNPGLIYASASGYGSKSPYRDLPGQDLLIQAISGFPAVTGRGDGPPIAAGAVVADQHAATLLALGILGALHGRQRTGEGQEVEVTMLESSLDLQSEGYACHLNGATLTRARTGIATTYHEAPYGFYEVQDGYVALSISPIAQVSEALGNPLELEPYLDPSVAFTRREEIYVALSPLLRPFTRDGLIERLRASGVWCAPVYDYAEALADPALQALDPITEFEHPRAGTVRVTGHPIRYSSGRAAVERVPPALGEHTDEVLQSLGYSAQEVNDLRTEGVVR
jgi:crotonobetainyl-CoA:carnitine CoA-transferase CaiB-like acyl-CoA transferase